MEWFLGFCGAFALVLLWVRLSSVKSKTHVLERELARFREAGMSLEHRMWSLEQWAGSMDERMMGLHEQMAQGAQAAVAVAPGFAPGLAGVARPVAPVVLAGGGADAEDASDGAVDGAASESADAADAALQEARDEVGSQEVAARVQEAGDELADAAARVDETSDDAVAQDAAARVETSDDAAQPNPYINPALAAYEAAHGRGPQAGHAHGAQAAHAQGAQAMQGQGPQATQGQGPQAAQHSHAQAGHAQGAQAAYGQGAQAAQQDPSGISGLPKNIDLEQWLGVRGAAALGALVLVLAGVYFFQYSIEHNLITPAMRVVIGTIAGIGCIAGSELRLRTRHDVLANWLSGAGAAVLYLSFWASSALFGLVSPFVAGLLMVMVTATCCVLTVKRGSMAIALLGLLGGFATPILLSTGSDRPVALFSYLFLLDAALLYVAFRRRWPLLALASLLGTAGYQMAWVGFRMGPERVGWGMALTVMFALLYAVFSIGAVKAAPAKAEQPADENERLAWRATEVAGVLVPFLFALYFSVQAEMLPSLPMLMAYLAILVAGATVVGLRVNSEWLPSAAATSTLGVVAGWLLTHPITDAVIVQLCAGGVLLAIGAYVPLELPRWRDRAGLRYAAPIWLLGVWVLTLVTVGRAAEGTAPWPWLASWTVLTALAVRQAERTAQGWMHLVLPLGWTMSLLPVAELHITAFGPHASTWFAMLIVSLCALLHAGLLLAKRTRLEAAHASSLATLLLILPLLVAGPSPTALFASTVLLAALAAIACSRHGAGVWALISAVVIVAAQMGGWVSRLGVGDSGGLLPYATHAVTVVLLSAWPLLLKPEQRDTRSPWRVTAIVPWIFFLPMLGLHERLYGLDVIAPLPLALALVPMAVLLLQRFVGPKDPEVQNSAVVWLAGSAMSFITVAIPLQLDNEWITIGWALQGAALLMLWRRRDHAGLKWFAIALLGAVTVRLIGNPWVLDYHPRSTLRVLNWISYTYLVPALCMLAGAWALAKFELVRLRPMEEALTVNGKAIGWRGLVLAALAVIFVWLNLTIIDWYAPSRMLELDLQRLPARDLTISISWGIYALVLLAVGVWRKSGALRKLSLALLLITCGKVFLYDLAHLRELYRVMSLVGLALSLIAVSLAYRRFVFRNDDNEEEVVS